MDENVLKKQFGKKDVTRLRNLMTGKHNSKTGQSVGYNKKQSFYKEGDVWEEDGRKWTIKNGIKQNITKMDRAKKAYLTSLIMFAIFYFAFFFVEDIKNFFLKLIHSIFFDGSFQPFTRTHIFIVRVFSLVFTNINFTIYFIDNFVYCIFHHPRTPKVF